LSVEADISQRLARIERTLGLILQALPASRSDDALTESERRALGLLLPAVGTGSLDAIRFSAAQMLDHVRAHHPDIHMALKEAIGPLDGALPQSRLSTLLRHATGANISGFMVKAGRKQRGVQQWLVVRG
jgi:hypothetical protein